MTEHIERWLPVVGYEGYYEVSELGKVRSINRLTLGRWNTYKRTSGRLLKLSTPPGGYSRVDLNKKGNASSKFVHRLVAFAFLPAVEGKHQVNHLNSIRSDNRVENLEWCTTRENNIHAIAQGNIRRKRENKENMMALLNECKKVVDEDGTVYISFLEMTAKVEAL